MKQNTSKCIPMYAVVFLLAVSWASAQKLPDAPKITVDPATLLNFGVTLDAEKLNGLGLFQHLVSITPSRTSTDPTIKALAEAANTTVGDVYAHILDLSAAEVTRKIISGYRQLPERELAQFFSAHVINLYDRLFKLVNTFDTNAQTSLSQLNGITTAAHAEALCMNSEFIELFAYTVTRSIDKSSACQTLFEDLAVEQEELLSLIQETTRARANLDQVDKMLKSDTTPLSTVASFLKQNPVYPRFYERKLIGEIISAFSDYYSFYQQIGNNEQLTAIIGMPISEIVMKIAGYIQKEKLF